MLVMDIGGTFIKFGVIDEQCQITQKDKVKTPYESKENFVETINEIIRRHQNEISGVAISAPGLIDVDNGVMVTAGMLRYLDGFALVDELKKTWDFPISIENDAKAAALCESFLGSAKDVENTVVLIFGSGVGGGVVLNKQVHRGKQLIAGEFSATFMSLKENDYTSLSDEISTLSRVRKAQQIKSDESIMGERLMELYVENDEEIVKLVDNWFMSIAKVCYNMDCYYNPDCICIGGGISENPLFMQGIEKAIDTVQKEAYTFRKPVIRKCKFENDSNLIGAYYAFQNKYQ